MQVASTVTPGDQCVSVSGARVAEDSTAILIGLIGTGIRLSRSPALHEREGARQGLAYIYRLVDLETLGLGAGALPELVAAARRFGFTGLNITHPCKQAVIPLLDELSPDARALGAVNTVIFEPGGRSVGHNTDWSGFTASFRRELAEVSCHRIVLFGAGGAGAAVAHALLTLGTGALSIIDVNQARATRLAADLCGRFGAKRAVAPPDSARAVELADGIVNATPVGMEGHPGMPLARELLRPDLWIADIVYFPIETELLRAGRELGCRTMAGGGMAVFQAADAFRLFTGIEPDVDRMIRHFDSMQTRSWEIDSSML
jgi:shikimate dehydrogenase